MHANAYECSEEPLWINKTENPCVLSNYFSRGDFSRTDKEIRA